MVIDYAVGAVDQATTVLIAELVAPGVWPLDFMDWMCPA